MVELFPLPNEGVLLPTRSATSRYLKTEYTDHQVRYLLFRRFLERTTLKAKKSPCFLLKQRHWFACLWLEKVMRNDLTR